LETQELQSLTDDEVQSSLDLMFAYLRDVLYDPKKADLDPDELPEPFRDLGRGLLFIGQCVDQSRTLANLIARGDLDTSFRVSRDNDIASGLKNLQATLKHITWQVRQVAKGDYNQRLSFAGAFSDSINDMITQLKERDEALRDEIEINQQMAAEAISMVGLLESITKSIGELIIVVDRSTHDWLYTNHEPARYLPYPDSINELKVALAIKIDEYSREPVSGRAQAEKPLESLIELKDEDGSLSQFFTVVGYPITWKDHKSLVLILVDVTSDQQERQKLERVAYYDALTSTYSRHYGMLTLDRWLEEKLVFVVAFVDMDGLKYVNDSFGHSAGDEYIVATSEKLSSFGKQTVISRLGGDEFMVLIRHHTLEQAHERLIEMRAELAREYKGSYERSFSYGLVDVDSENTKSSSLILSIADESMYEDKRNRKKERRAEN